MGGAYAASAPDSPPGLVALARPGVLAIGASSFLRPFGGTFSQQHSRPSSRPDLSRRLQRGVYKGDAWQARLEVRALQPRSLSAADVSACRFGPYAPFRSPTHCGRSSCTCAARTGRHVISAHARAGSALPRVSHLQAALRVRLSWPRAHHVRRKVARTDTPAVRASRGAPATNRSLARGLCTRCEMRDRIPGILAWAPLSFGRRALGLGAHTSKDNSYLELLD